MAGADILPTVVPTEVQGGVQAMSMETPATQDDFLAGLPLVQGYRVLRPCVLYERLGRGGMGSVYRGYHLNLDIDVAVKLLISSGQSSEHVDRFQREAAFAAKVNAANLVRVFDVRHSHGLHYIIMELVDGESVADRVQRKGKLDAAEACTIAWEAAKGLAAAHAKKVIHRDLKPANVLVSREGEVKLADLGIASGERVGDTITTHVNVVMGTPQYMPPEQFRGAARCTTRSDVYSLGATLWMMLVGKDPFSGMTYEDIEDELGRVGLEDPRAYRSDIPSEVADLVCRAISRDPQARPEHGEALASELRRVLDGLGGPANLRDLRAGTTTGSRFASPTREVLKKIKTSVEQQIPETLAPGGMPIPVPPPAAGGATAWDRTSTRGSGRGLAGKLALIAGTVILVGGGAVLVAQRLSGSPSGESTLISQQWEERRGLLEEAIKGGDPAAIIEAWKAIDELRGVAPQEKLEARRLASSGYYEAMRLRLEDRLSHRAYEESFELIAQLRRDPLRLLDDAQLRELTERAGSSRRTHYAQELRQAGDALNIERFLEIEQALRGGPNVPRDSQLQNELEQIREAMLQSMQRAIEGARERGEYAAWESLEVQRSRLSPDRYTEAQWQQFHERRFEDALSRGQLDEAERLLREAESQNRDTLEWASQLRERRSQQLESDLAEMLRRLQWEQARRAVEERGGAAGVASIPAKLQEIDEAFFTAFMAQIEVLSERKDWEQAFRLLAEAAESKVNAPACQEQARLLVQQYETYVPDDPVQRTRERGWSAQMRRDVKRVAETVASPEAAWLYATSHVWYNDREYISVATDNFDDVHKFFRQAQNVRPMAFFYLGDLASRRDGQLQRLDAGEILVAAELYRMGASRDIGDCHARLGQIFESTRIVNKPDELRRDPLPSYDRAVELGSQRGMLYRGLYQFNRLADGVLDVERDRVTVRQGVEDLIKAAQGARGFPGARDILMRWRAVMPEIVSENDLRRSGLLK